MKRYLSIILIGMGLSGSPATYGDTETGVDALGRGQYDQALDAFLPGAKQGDLADQIFLGHTYTLLENYEEAYAWYHLSAGCGSIDAEIELAVLSRKLSEETIEAGRTRGEAYREVYCPE